MRIHYFQHDPDEDPAAILDWAHLRGAGIQATRWDAGERLEALPATDLLVVMGGPMSVHDTERFPWLGMEKARIAEQIARGGRILGICLGAQLLAEALGAEVFPNPTPEIGWYPVKRTPQTAESLLAPLGDEALVLHWHGETFSLPPDATLLATSERCHHQAFSVRSVFLGLQFHLEMTPNGLERLATAQAAQLRSAPGVQSREELLSQPTETWHATHDRLFRILDRLVTTASSPSK